MKRHASMNRIYRLVWSKVRNAWIAVSENAKGCGKSGRARSPSRRKIIVAALSLAFAPLAQGAPIGGQVVSGAGSISQSGSTTTIKQSSQNLSLSWQSFNIASQETVNFLQPSATAIAVNRIFDTNGTQILGHLNANGQVWLINPNGILFGQGAQVNVGGLVASTLDLNDATLNGTARTFSDNGTGSVVNKGTINAADGRYVALLGNTVSNQGIISAHLGTVALGAGSAATLTFSGNSLVKMQVDKSTLNNLAENKQLIQADGGQVIMTAGAANTLLASVVNNTGVIEARTVENHNGTITLLGGMKAGQVTVGGTLDASAPDGGNGGFIETSAAHVNISSSAQVTTAATNGLTGTWLIDPVDFTIAASGGDMTGAILSASLGTSNVTILSRSGASGTAGNVNVNDVVTWSAHMLTLNAQNNININANLNGSGTASLALQYGQDALAAGNTSNYFLNNGAQVNLPAGNHFSTKLGSDGVITNYTVITSLGTAGSTTGTDLQGMSGNLIGNYVLGSNINATATSTWNYDGTTYAGFAPVGNSFGGFTGIFDGLGHIISNLTINQPTASYIGLFGWTQAGAMIRNVGLVGGSMTGYTLVGGLVGYNGTGSTVSNSYATSSVTGLVVDAGGLVGYNDGTISNSYATGNVDANSSGGGMGGLVGANTGLISNSYATGSVGNVAFVGVHEGGLVGYNTGTVTNSFATGRVVAVVGNSYASGGLVGENLGTVSNSYATGSMSGTGMVGGLVGWNYGTVSNSYATGSVTGTGGLGGLVGMNSSSGTISNSYATGNVSGGASSGWIGGLVGGNSGTISSSYATGNVSGGANSAGIGGLVGMGARGASVNSSVTNSYATGNVSGGSYVGGLLGGNYGSISNSYAMGSVTGDNFVGGLVGLNHDIGTISHSYATGSVGSAVSGYRVGGLVGWNVGSVSNSYATGGVVSTASYVGGLVGENSGTVSNSYATGNVVATGGNEAGGLVGFNSQGTISSSYATGSVNSTGDEVGGLVGFNYLATVSNSYATGSVTGNSNVGGLVGFNYGGNYGGVGKVANSYSTGSVTGSTNVGGLVGFTGNGATVTSSYWDTTTSGQSTSSGGTGRTTAQMQTQSTFAGWDFTNTWIIYNGFTYPLLRSFMTPLTVTANNASKTYDGLAYSGGNGVTYSITPNGNLLGTVNYGGTSQGAKNAGTYSIVPSGLYSSQLGYLISYVNGTLTIGKAALSLTVTGSSATNKIYNGTTTATLTGGILNGVLTGDTVTLNQSGTFASKNVGTNIAVTATDTLGGASAGNYSLTEPTGLYANITPKSISLSGSRAYNGTTTVASSIFSLSGMVTGETLSLSGSGSVASMNVSAGTQAVTLGTLALGNGTGLASNYTFTGGTQTATFTQATLTVTGTLVNNKVYDGTTTDILTGGTLNGVIGSDAVTLTQTGTFSSKNVGTSLAVTAADSLSGSSSSNYKLTQPTGLHANITARPINLSGSRVYNATTTVSSSMFSLSNMVAGETLILSGSGSVASMNVSAGTQAVTLGTLALGNGTGGGLASNYTFTGGTQTATFTQATLTVTGTLVNNKVYDGTTTATLTNGTLNGVFTGDTVTLTQAGTFASQNVGTGLTVTATDSLGGASGSNYSLIQPTGLSSNITARPVTLIGGRVYDGTTVVSSGIFSLSNLVTGETLNLSGSGSVASKNVSAGTQAVTLGTLALGNGTGLASNYTFTGGTQTANFTAANLSISGITAGNKVYDGNTTATVSTANAVYAGLVANDNVSVSATGVFSDKNVATGKTVTLTSNYTGSDVSNYIITNQASTTANITQLSSVTWVGPTTGGNWSNPANWAGGAIPDLSNVANVVIPVGNNVTFDSSVAGPVNLSQINSDGLTINSGTMNVASALNVQNYSQSGGNVGGAGSFTVTNAFTQTAGQIAMGGDVNITHATGNLSFASIAGNNVTLNSSTGGAILGNLSAVGALGITAAGGTITQSGGTAATVGGTTTLAANNGGSSADITLANTGNTFAQTVSASGNNIALTSAGSLALGTVTAVGNLTVNSTGTLDIGTLTVGNNLAVNSGNGDVTQTGSLSVVGTTDITAGTGNIVLMNSGNVLQGTVTASGNTVNIYP